jgi:hypothetical protein
MRHFDLPKKFIKYLDALKRSMSMLKQISLGFASEQPGFTNKVATEELSQLKSLTIA